MNYTDEQIKKAYICCFDDEGCKNCPLKKDRTTCDNLNEHILDLINRQEAEIERLKGILASYALQYGSAMDKEAILKKAKSEARKEFWEELKKHSFPGVDCATTSLVVFLEDGDDLLTEMEGERENHD